MSKPTDDFWHSLGWAICWLSFFGGIALLVWVTNRYTHQDERYCVQQHGEWVQQAGLKWNEPVHYYCKFGGKP